MRAAAQFHGHALDLDHAHFVAVFFAEKRRGPLGPGRFDAEHFGHHRGVQQDRRIDLVLHPGQLVRGHGRDMGKVKAQPVRRHQRTGLIDVAAQHVFKGLVQQMGAGVVAGGGGMHGNVHDQLGFLVEQNLAGFDLDMMRRELRPGLDGPNDGHVAGQRGHKAHIAGLSAGFAVKGGHGADHIAGLTGNKPLDSLAVGGNKRIDPALRRQLVIAHKARLHAGFEQFQEQHGRVGLAGALPGLFGPGLLLGHGGPVAVLIGRDATLAGHIVDDIQREAVGVVELEGELASDDRLAGRSHAVEFLGQNGQPLIQGDAEPLLFLAHHPLHKIAAGTKLRESLAHDIDHHAGSLIEERVGQAEQLPEPQGPANQPTQHIAPALVGGHDAIGQEKSHGPAVIADDPQGGVVLVVVAVGHPGDGGGRSDDGLKKINVEIGMHALDNGGNALQAHAGVDAGTRQGHAVARLDLVVLHEHEVPDFEIPVAVALADAAVRAAAHGLAPVVHDLGTGAAGAGVAHGPEIVLVAQAKDAVVGEAGNLFPQPVGLVVVEVDRGIQA